jgi:hypothetical protein
MSQGGAVAELEKTREAEDGCARDAECQLDGGDDCTPSYWDHGIFLSAIFGRNSPSALAAAYIRYRPIRERI